MNKKVLYVFLILLAGLIAVLVYTDHRSTQLDKRPDNPYAYDISEFEKVDPAMIHYSETRNIRLGKDKARGISWFDNHIYLVTENNLQVISQEGQQESKMTLTGRPNCIQVVKSGIFIGFDNLVSLYNFEGQLIRSYLSESDSSHFTSVAFHEGLVAVADAGQRVLLLFNEDGTLIRKIYGKRESEDLHGFIVPSFYFDVAFTPDGELWVVNPGMHALENYTTDGNLRSHWAKPSMDISGFSGCCNPAHMAILPDGFFVTAEKGLVRVKEYKPSGELSSVVAPPSSFETGKTAPDLAVTSAGEILALDFDRNSIRIFEKKDQHGS
ncbi:MAG: hypothetical protein PHN30_00385 [Bacteroidales bacterium]|jgi:hypothetical protein|nr:hypothetical protein [Bacteroidales bacterium]MDD3384156.1 hypothetical protein [Bacteroidales bacterium]MDD3870832.1 hypothetical protein [Bacteroidales bacterium]MDD4812358.1 hypothetical protein [Bacteroidales bacterium]NLO68272.1 hypothetical protein [Bacteroidales bacterium]